ncbi:MAG: hypothetical protein ACK4K7_07820 [Allosphingosinicella sp.]|uniref:hypothetical protein n=1 Tax=Allosphingosinicella sp. TaxID=2823234 RepID=UPI0039217307
MNASRPFASLSSGLLARKGAAKPAMRPQGFVQGASLEDLGWNDMGVAEAPPLREHVPSPIDALTPAPRPAPVEELPTEAETALPPVVEQQRAIAESFAEPEAVYEPVAEPESEPEPVAIPAAVVKLPRRRAKAGAVAKAKAAFTLRLDADRHLKLRLASAILGRSSQQIVTEALDDLIASLPEVEALAGRVPAGTLKRSSRT